MGGENSKGEGPAGLYNREEEREVQKSWTPLRSWLLGRYNYH